MQREDLYLRKTLKGAAEYFRHSPEEQAKIAKISHATWYRRMNDPGSFTLREIRRLIAHYKIDISEVADFLGIRRSH